MLTLALSLALVVLPSPQALAVQLFSDNFETGVLVPPWTATANFTNQTAIVFAGARGRATTTRSRRVRLQGPLAGPGQRLPQDPDQGRQHGGHDAGAALPGGGAGTNIASLNRNNSGALVRKNHVTASQDATSATTLALNTWYDLQIHALINGTSSASRSGSTARS